MLIRRLRVTDREAVGDMLAACRAFSDEEVSAALEIFDCAEYTHFGVEYDGALAGYVCLDRIALTRSTWFVYWICIHPSWQRRGFAAALMGHAAEFVRSAGGERLVLETSGRQDYEGVRRFYGYMGFREVGRIADYYKPGDDCVYFCKLLV